MAHDVRIIRLPRHGASCPIGLGVSCSADRNIKCKINKDGIWIEKMDDKPGELIPAALREAGEGDVVKIDLNQPMADILKELTKYPVATRLSLNGTIIVGRDIAHAKLKERLDRGDDLPQYIKDHPIYYAGPAKTPEGMACGSMGDVYKRQGTCRCHRSTSSGLSVVEPGHRTGYPVWLLLGSTTDNPDERCV